MKLLGDGFQRRASMATFLNQNYIRCRDLKRFLIEHAEKVKVHAQQMAEEHKRPYPYLENKIRMEYLVPAYQTFTEHRGLLLDFARPTDTIVVDLDSMLPRGGPMRARLFHEDGVHPTGALHAQFADQIRRTLDEEASKLGLTACLSDS